MAKLPVKWKLYLLLTALLIAGLALPLLAPFVWSWLAHLLEELSTALVVASILGLSVDLALKTELTRDVFEAAFSYVLPEELRQEVKRVINYTFMCKECSVIIETTAIDERWVRVTVSFEREIENVTDDTRFFEPYIDIDEWGVEDQPSGLIYYDVSQAGVRKTAKRDADGPGRKLIFRGCLLRVPSRGRISVIGKYHETRAVNGEISVAWKIPTVAPCVTVRLAKGFEHTCSFGIPAENIKESSIETRYKLDGTQFPGQEITVRWWPQAKLQRFVKSKPY